MRICDWSSDVCSSDLFSADFLRWYTDTVEQTGTAVLAALAQFAIEADARPYQPRITAPVLCLYPQKGAIANNEQQDAPKTLVRNIANGRAAGGERVCQSVKI